MEGAAVIYTNKASNGDLNGVHFSIDSSAEDDTITSTDSTPKYTGKYNSQMDNEYLENMKGEAIIKSQDRKLPKRVRYYYKKQRDLIISFLNQDETGNSEKLLKDVALAGKISFLANVFLILAKAIAVGLSGSLAIVSSLVDSAVDLVSGVIIWYTSRAMRRMDRYRYPIGRTRLEPVAIVILSCIMASASVVMIRESIEGIISKKISVDLSAISISLVAVTIVTKFALYMYCRRYDTPSTQALATDHVNDTVSNAFALMFGALGSYVWIYADAIGAMLITVIYLLTSGGQVLVSISLSKLFKSFIKDTVKSLIYAPEYRPPVS